MEAARAWLSLASYSWPGVTRQAKTLSPTSPRRLEPERGRQTSCERSATPRRRERRPFQASMAPERCNSGSISRSVPRNLLYCRFPARERAWLQRTTSRSAGLPMLLTRPLDTSSIYPRPPQAHVSWYPLLISSSCLHHTFIHLSSQLYILFTHSIHSWNFSFCVARKHTSRRFTWFTHDVMLLSAHVTRALCVYLGKTRKNTKCVASVGSVGPVKI